MEKSKRFGLILLTADFVELNTDLLADVLAEIKFVPISVSYVYTGHYEYIGISELFKEVEEGCEAKHYELNIICNVHGKLSKIELKEV